MLYYKALSRSASSHEITSIGANPIEIQGGNSNGTRRLFVRTEKLRKEAAVEDAETPHHRRPSPGRFVWRRSDRLCSLSGAVHSLTSRLSAPYKGFARRPA